jgi:nucleotide-binding universal stress UspA family protein
MTEVPANTIVVGVDGSETSDRAVDWAAEQARLEGRALTLVQATGAMGTAALVWLDQAGVDSELTREAVRRDAEQLLAAAGERVAAIAPDVPAHGVVAELDPRDALRETARSAAMVVLGSRGRGLVKSLLLGSVAHAVSRDGACPIVVLRPVADSVVRRGIVVGVDAQGTSTAALAFAYRLASLRRRPLRVVHAIWDAHRGEEPVGPDEEGYDAERLRLAQTVAGMAEQYPDVEVETVLSRGLVDRVLVRLAEEAELVVVGRRSRGGIAGLVRGRTASIVVEQSSGTVAVVPEP